MNIIYYMQEKYKKRKQGNHYVFPAGGKDIMKMCYTITNLEKLIEDIKEKLSNEEQYEIDKKIHAIDILDIYPKK